MLGRISDAAPQFIRPDSARLGAEHTQLAAVIDQSEQRVNQTCFSAAARPQNSCNFAVPDNGLRVTKHDVAVICHPEAAQLDSRYARVGLPTDSAFLFGVFVGKRQCFLQSPIGNKMHAELLYGSARVRWSAAE